MKTKTELKLKKLDNRAHVLIVGLGLIGGSYAKALSKRGFAVNAITAQQADIDYAVKEGFLREGSVQVSEQMLAWADLVVLALYPHTLIDWVEQYGQLLAPGTLVTDVTGVKGSIVDRVQDLMPDGVEFIAAHPMAGREKSGVANSDDRVFYGANYIVVPTARNTPDAISVCVQLGEALGFHRISRLSAEEHDRMIAFLSQLTHCIAVSLMCANEQPGMEVYTGDSFRDLTRIARINDEMWSELFLWNREALLQEMDRFSAAFAHLRKALEDGDRDEMRRMMRLSGERREKFDKPTVETIVNENDDARE